MVFLKGEIDGSLSQEEMLQERVLSETILFRYKDKSEAIYQILGLDIATNWKAEFENIQILNILNLYKWALFHMTKKKRQELINILDFAESQRQRCSIYKYLEIS